MTDNKLTGPITIDAMDLAHSSSDSYTPSNDCALYLSTNHTLSSNPSYNANVSLMLTAHVEKNLDKLLFSSNATTHLLRGKLCMSMAWQTIEGCGITVACVTWADASNFVYERETAVFYKTQAGFDIFINCDYGDNQRRESVIALAHAELVRTAIMRGVIH